MQNEFYTAYNGINATWMVADCDVDGINNGDELAGPDGDLATPGDATNPYFVEFEIKPFTNGRFTNVTFNDGGTPILWGLNIITHDTSARTISGTYSFVSNSIGETPIRSYVITEGEFDVAY